MIKLQVEFTFYIVTVLNSRLKLFFILQVILSPVDSVADTYRALLPKGTSMEFQRILELKVMTYDL